jgi:hypothetical protein
MATPEYEFVSVEDAIDLHASVIASDFDQARSNVMNIGLLE